MKLRNVYLSLVFVIAMVAFVCAPGMQAVVPPERTSAQLYSRYCISCHGRDGRSQTSKGKFSHARDLTDAKWQDDVTDERIYNSIMNGRDVRGNMPGFKNKLNQKEAESLVDMVRKFRK
jgi:mono/diheme cytochrome c family protein